MRAAALVALALSVGCVTPGRVASLERELAELRAPRADAMPLEAAQLGGPEASAPVASLGTWVPVQAAKQTLLAQALIPPVTLTGAQTITGAKTFSQTVTSSKASGNAFVVVDGAKYCMNATCTVHVAGDGFGGLVMATGLGGNVTGNLSSSGNIISDEYISSKKAGAGPPTAADCDAEAERGRQYHDTTNNRHYFCAGATRLWDYVALTD